jgi:hypothetical protein
VVMIVPPIAPVAIYGGGRCTRTSTICSLNS